MRASLIAVLTDAERQLIAETDTAELAALDEDAALALEARIRQARDKYVGMYRRGASARVPQQGGRGAARPLNTRAAAKAEAFETALARVSRRVAVLARQSAAQLREERLEAARAARQGRGPSGRYAPPEKGKVETRRPDAHRALRTPASEKARASTQAMGAKRQGRRDSRQAGGW
jgi:hypothetical protein